MTTRPENAAAESMRPNRSSPAATRRSDAAGSREVLHVGDDLDRGPERLELVDQPFLRIADHEVVTPGREQPGQRRPDVEVGVGDEGDAARLRFAFSVM